MHDEQSETRVKNSYVVWQSEPHVRRGICPKDCFLHGSATVTDYLALLRRCRIHKLLEPFAGVVCTK